mgnify:CR=1 FL=1
MNAEQAREKKTSLEKKRFPRFREMFRLKCCLEMSEARAFRGGRAGRGREGEEVDEHFGGGCRGGQNGQ